MSEADAFRDLVEPHRGELRLHCYRLLGSLTDADDVLQEVLLAAWRGLDTFEGRAAPRTWLYRIATNRCLNAIRDGRRRIPAEPLPPFDPPEPTRRGDVTWLQPYPETPETRAARRETVELAFIVALQRLPPRQAATLVLRDVLGYSAPEVADMLGTTEVAVKGALQRARATLRTPGGDMAPAAERELSRRFAKAFVDRDLDRLLALLTDDAWLAMPPAPHEYHGHAAIAEFLRTAWAATTSVEVLRPTRANGQPAFDCRLGEGEAEAGIIVLTCTDDRISGITRFLRPHHGRDGDAGGPDRRYQPAEDAGDEARDHARYPGLPGEREVAQRRVAVADEVRDHGDRRGGQPDRGRRGE
jgi:RNA polymerase sigma-70 factor (TIGR02960 family)